MPDVERLTPMLPLPPAGRGWLSQTVEMNPEPHGEFVRFEDHQQALLAEEQKRGEVEEEREEWRAKAERYRVEWTNWEHEAKEHEAVADEATAAKEMYRGRAEAAESRLSAVEAELERLSAERAAERDATKPTDPFRTKVRAGLDGESIAFRIAAGLLRDKGTEQGHVNNSCAQPPVDKKSGENLDSEGTEQGEKCEKCGGSGTRPGNLRGSVYDCPACCGTGRKDRKGPRATQSGGTEQGGGDV